MLEDRLMQTLIDFGITPGTKGFRYILYATLNFDPDMSAMDMYKMVGERYNATPSNVERAMRHAFSKMDFKSAEIQEFFGKKFTTIGYVSILAWKCMARMPWG